MSACFSEEYDPATKRMIGNFPQAFSHLGLIVSASHLSAAHPSPLATRVDHGGMTMSNEHYDVIIIAIVTGGNSGIGKAIALSARRHPAPTSSIDYVANPQATEDLEQQIVALGDQAIGVDADVSKVADLQKLIDTTVKEFGRADIMVNNAGSRDPHVRARHRPKRSTRRCSRSI